MEKQDLNLMEQFITLSRLLVYRNHHMKGNLVHSPYRGQGRVLSLLKIESKMSQKKLSFLLGIRPQSMGELLVKLEQNGDIIRTPSNEDKRALYIELTEKGMQTANENEASLDDEQKSEDVFSCLTLEEQSVMSTYIERLVTELKAEMPEDHEAFLQHHHMHHHHEEDPHGRKKCKHKKHEHKEQYLAIDEVGPVSKGEPETNCPICKHHCDLRAPKCKRGEKYAKANKIEK
jgi:DNA-binding MarR family transcriptional regulator